MLAPRLALYLKHLGIHYAWVIAALTFLAMLVTSAALGLPGALMQPLSQEFGWSTTELSSVFAIRFALYGLLGPFAAMVLMRYGVSRMVAMAAAVIASSLLLGVFMHSLGQAFALWGLLLGVGTGLTAMVLGATVANRWFVQRKGLVMGLLAGQEAVINLIGFYLDQPLAALFSGLLLIYAPPLLDILPIYIVFMLASPVLLLHGLHRGWGGILGLSLLAWLLAQFDLGEAVYNAVTTVAPIPVPYRQTGSFEIWGWQFLWVLGLWMGSMQAERPDAPPLVFPRWMVNTAVGIALVGFVWRHVIGQNPFPGQASLAPLFDKWHLGPLRLINFMALLLLTMHFAPWLRRHLPRLPVLETLGRASLPVFCAHLVLALLALALAGDVQPQRPYWVDAAIVAVSFPALYLVAWVSGELDRRTAAKRAALKQRMSRKPRPQAAGVSAPSTPASSAPADPPAPLRRAVLPQEGQPAAPRPAADAG